MNEPSTMHFDMDAERVEVDQHKTGPTFKLAGEEFTCLPAVPGSTTQRIAMAMRVDDRGRQVFNAPNVIGYLEECLIVRRWIDVSDDEPDFELLKELTPEQRDSITDDGGYWEPADDRQRFLKVLDSTENIIELETLGDLMGKIAEAYGERPTRRSRRSRGGR